MSTFLFYRKNKTNLHIYMHVRPSLANSVELSSVSPNILFSNGLDDVSVNMFGGKGTFLTMPGQVDGARIGLYLSKASV